VADVAVPGGAGDRGGGALAVDWVPVGAAYLFSPLRPVLAPGGQPLRLADVAVFAKQMVPETANLTVEVTVGSQLSATVSDRDL
jgi:hypothetical protein